MEGRKIFLIFALFMAISLAYEAPGFFRDSSVPEKWGFLRRNKEAKDEPERRKENLFCEETSQPIQLPDRKFGSYWYTPEQMTETFCSEDMQICSENKGTYCSTTKENVDVKYVTTIRGRPRWKIVKEELRRRCECVYKKR